MPASRPGKHVLLHVALTLMAFACRHGCRTTAAQVKRAALSAPDATIADKPAAQNKIVATDPDDPEAPFLKFTAKDVSLEVVPADRVECSLKAAAAPCSNLSVATLC